MISAFLALGLNLTIAPPAGGPAAGSSLPPALVTLDGERPSWGIVRRAILREKLSHPSRSLDLVPVAAGLDPLAPHASLLYTAPLLTPARPAATPSSQRDPPSRDQVV